MNRGYTGNAASIRFEGGQWGGIEMKNPLLSPQSAALSGSCAARNVRVTACEGGMAVLCLKQAAAELSFAAEQAGLPAPDADAVFEAVCRLCDLERETLYGGGRFIARLTLACTDEELFPGEPSLAVFAARLWYEPEPDVLGETELTPAVDAVYERYVEDPVFFRIGGRVAYPQGGIMCALAKELMKSWNVEGEVRRVSTDELEKALREGELKEAFLVGDLHAVTAVTSLFGHTLPVGKLTRKLSETVFSIESGTYPSPGNVIII